MDFVFKAFFLQFLVLGLLLQVVRPQTGGTDCRGKDYLCLDDVRFQLCVDYGDGRPVTVNDEVQQCPTGTFCSNGGHYECDSFVPPATTAAPQVADVTETEVPAEEVTTSVPVEVEEATLPPVEEPEPEVAVPEEPAQEPVTTTTEAEVPEVTEAQDSSVAPETTVGVVEEEEPVTETTAPATEPVEVEVETTTTGAGPAVTEEVETTEEAATEEAATEEVVAATTEPSQPEVPEVTEAAPELEQETEAVQEQETTVGADVEVTTTAAPEQEEQTETESSVTTDAPVEEGEAGPEEPVVTEAPATTENVETQAPVEPSTTVTEETSEVVSESTTDLPEVEVPVTTAAPEEEAASSTVPETTPAPVVPTEEPSNSESGGSDEGESSQGSAQESTEQPSVESGSGSDEAATTTTTTTSPVAPSDAPFVCTAAGRFPHPTDCHKYYICFWLPFGLYNLEQNCLAGFAYNPTLERCTADQSVCFPGQFTCTAPGRFPDPADPTKYFWCVWNAFGGYLQYGLQCPLGQVFNQFRGRCAFIVAGRSLDAEEPLLTGEEEWTNGPEEENAVLPPVAPVEPLAPQVEPVTPKLKVKFECLEEGTFADPNNCARYFVCTLKKLDKFKKSKFKCITGERFDALVGACVPDLDALCE